MAEISLKTILIKYEILARFSPLEREQDGIPKKWDKILLGTTQTTPILNFIEIQLYLDKE